MSLRRISDLAPANIQVNANTGIISNPGIVSGMLFEVSQPKNARENSMYESRTITYSTLSSSMLGSAFDWMYRDRTYKSFNLSGNLYFNYYYNGLNYDTTIRNLYDCQLYFKTCKIECGYGNTPTSLELNEGTLNLNAKTIVNTVIDRQTVVQVNSAQLSAKAIKTNTCTTNTLTATSLSATNIFNDKLNITSGLTINNGKIILSSNGNISCDILSGTAVQSKWADVAEYYAADKKYEPGTLVKFGGTAEITIADNEANAVVTTAPGFILNGNDTADIKVGIALVGRTPVKVRGSVQKFDNLYLDYVNGVASTHPLKSKTVIAKALESKSQSDYDISLVECVVKLNF